METKNFDKKMETALFEEGGGFVFVSSTRTRPKNASDSKNFEGPYIKN